MRIRDDDWKLLDQLITNERLLRFAFPYVYRYKWDVVPGKPDYGNGHVVFTNGSGVFVVVEVKWLGYSAQSGPTVQVPGLSSCPSASQSLGTHVGTGIPTPPISTSHCFFLGGGVLHGEYPAPAQQVTGKIPQLLHPECIVMKGIRGL